ncbi:MAG: YgiT-type zinc finger protein [bacterium]|nr:YgiT-type zinc finger protein [bacterium]
MKGLITICSECRGKTKLKEITIKFDRKGIQALMTGIPAMVCPQCGQEYVPGAIAGDVIATVSQTIDQVEGLLKRSQVQREKLLLDRANMSPERLELRLAS